MLAFSQMPSLTIFLVSSASQDSESTASGKAAPVAQPPVSNDMDTEPEPIVTKLFTPDPLAEDNDNMDTSVCSETGKRLVLECNVI